MHGKDDDGKSQWAVLLDPNGAAFGIIPTVSAEAAPPTDGPESRDAEVGMGRIAWLDLTVPDASATRDFYCEVVGWSVQEVEMEDEKGRYSDYSLLSDDGNPAVGVCHARGENLGLPPIWMLYLPVGDLGESLRRVRAEGGEIIKVRRGDDGESADGILRDPVGACLALVQG